jgi:hypothetical protein
MTDDDMAAAIQVLQQQQSLQSSALKAALEGRWSGDADSVDGFVQALTPGIQTDPLTPLYPRG